MERILIVDDEESIRTFIGAVLESEGLKVTLAEDGDEAARLLQQYNFHLMVTDLRMPGLDGMALIRKVRAEEPEMEVIVLTAHGTVENAVEAMKLGAFDYLTKPLSGPDEIALTVMRALERRRLREHRHRADVLEQLLVLFKELYLLTDLGKDRNALAHDTLARFLGLAGMAAPSWVASHTRLPLPSAQRLVRVTEPVVAKSTAFRFTVPVVAMSVIPQAGTPIAEDGGHVWTTPYDDCVLVMPSQRRFKPGQTMVRLGQYVAL